MKTLLVVLLVLAGGKKNQSAFTLETGAQAAPAGDKEKKTGKSKGTILLNGVKTTVNWSDGDSFRILDGDLKDSGTRLVGYNTLEAYGPVHRWGGWTAKDLWEIERGDTAIAASQEWKCTSDLMKDGYGRLLIDCPGVALELVKLGHAMAYAIEGTTAAPELLQAQKQAQEKKVGIWAKGVPRGIVTSLHALGEEGGKGGTAYNRVVDTKTGEALKRAHKDNYEVCQEVCVETEGTSSCMTYVPFDRRFKNRADCLKVDK